MNVFRRWGGWLFSRPKGRRFPNRVRLGLEILEDRLAPSANPITVENQLPGTPQSVWGVNGAGDPSIQGFSTDISVDQGQTISFKINDMQNAPYHIDIYRMGYYQGDGARLVTTIQESQVQKQVQPKPLTDNSTGLVDAGNWAVSASWAVPTTATSGIYMARVTRDDNGGASMIYFVVRDDGSHSDILFQTSDSTWQAYNNWDGTGTATSYVTGNGSSLYVYSGNNSKLGDPGAAAVSYNRPLIDDATTGGLGDYNSPLHAEFPMVYWLEENGYDVSYFTDVDSARYGNLIDNHKVFLSVGHDEYWSAQQRDNVEAALASGVNLAFFSGNEVYWKTRWQSSIDSSATPYRTLVTYKQSQPNAPLDPLDSAPTWTWTGTWRDINGGAPADGYQPENGLTGNLYMADRTNVDLGIPLNVPSTDANLRFWANTSVAGLQPGQTASLGQFIVGYETNQDVDNGFRPAGLIDMSNTAFSSQSVVQNQSGTQVGPGNSSQQITLYRAPSGALVFGAGTVQWSWGLSSAHNDTPSAPNVDIQQATVNLLADMNAQPQTLQAGLVPATASTDVTPPTSTITAPTANANLTVGSSVTITGTATDAGGGVVAGVEVSTDGGITWHPAVLAGAAATTVNWSYTWVPAAPGPIVLKSRAVDDSANIEIPSAGVTVNVSYQPTNTTGLVAAYSFDEGSGTTVADASGHGNTGTISNATWTTGLFGDALSFNGTNSWVTVNGSSSLNLTTGMTLEAWVKPTATSTNWTAVMLKERTNGLDYALYATDGANQPPGGYVDTANTDYDAKGLSVLPVNGWSFLTATYDGSNLDLYVNGNLVTTETVSGPITTSTGALRIGGDSIWGEYFQGLIDNIRVYSRPLNVGEIRGDMSTPVGGALENVPPTGSITGPANGATVSGVTTLTANASDNVKVASVQFLLNGQDLGQAVTAAPYSLAWDTRKVANGTYTLSAIVSDVAGNTTMLGSETITVNNPPNTTPPTVNILNPGNSAVHGTIVPWAVAADNLGITSVQFQLNGVNVGPQLTAGPYRFAWNSTTVADGTYTLTAVATDVSGITTTSSPVSVTVDNTLPTITAETPAPLATDVGTSAPGITATFSEAVQPGTIGFLLKDSGGNTISGAVAYNAATNTATFTPSGSLDPSRTYTVTVSGAQDLAGNTMAPFSWSFTTTSTVINATIWSKTATPAVASADDNRGQELGVKFTSDTAGFITGIQFYKGAGNTGTHVGHLWTSTGTLLASATFTNETATGWQQVFFSQPVAIQANTTYIASYYAPNGGYSYDSAYFASSGVDAGVLHALPNSAGSGNGVFAGGSLGVFPNNSFNATNYWVDVVFSNVLVPSVISTTPVNNATGVDNTAPNITATFSKAVQASTISFTLADSSGNAVAGNVSYNPTSNVVTFTPSAALAGLTTYRATISGAQDTSGNTMVPYSWSFTTAAPDTTPPTVVATTPASGAALASFAGGVTATFSKPVQAGTISFTLTDASGNPVAATLSYNAATNTATLTPSGGLMPTATYTATVSGAQDLAGNTMNPVSWSFTTAPKINNVTIWSSTATPAVSSANDSNPQELGVKFTSDTAGYITGLRFYKGAGNAGTHVAHLWTSTGVLLASATFTGESASGWQQVNFDAPVAIQANTTYIASYFDPDGHYSYSSGYFASGGTDNGVLHAPSNAAAGGNGVFVATSTGAFPTNSFNATNYWVDVVFSNTLAPTVVDTTPAANAKGVPAATPNITATFNEEVEAHSVSFTLTDASGNLVAATVTWQPAPDDSEESDVLTLTPHSALVPFTTYTATVSGATDAAGNTMAAPYSWSFTTVPSTPITGATIWSNAATPAVASANDGNAQELGMKFTSDVSGYVTGVRFYKGGGNTGTHVGRLWSADGTLLASATFSNETATGWQQVFFSQPVAIQANTTYIVSYDAPAGHYAYSSAYFASGGTDNGVLHALSNEAANGNGVYGGLGAFPTNSYNATNYWVDVLFSNTLTPVVTATTPAANATGVSVNPVITATFSGPMDPTTITPSTFYLRATGSPTNVAATVSYSGTTATLTPTAPLALNTTYQVTIVGTVADPNGHSLGTNTTWSFTTQQYPTFTDTTAADFGAGTPDANTAVVQTGDGEVILKPTMDAEFSGAALPSGWTTTSLGSGSQASVSGGQLTLDGTLAGTSGLYTPGRSLEFTATFSGDPYQSIGLATNLNAGPWAIFSTGPGGALYAETSSGASSTNTLLTGNFLGGPHDFRIDWTSTGVVYSIDGVQVASHAIAITAPMRPVADDNNVGGGTLSVDWMRLTPYASSGTFQSQVFDAGSAVTWLDAQWAATVPTGTSLGLSVRMGNTPTPDATWTDFIPLAGSGAAIGGSSRYIQYQVNLATTNSSQTPVLQAVTLEYTQNADTVAPKVLSETPASNATGVDLFAPIKIKVNELMNATTIDASTVFLQAQGSPTNVAATVSYSGSTITLQPSAALTGNTVYTVTVSSAVADAAGNTLGNNVTWSFTTGTGQVTQTTAADFNAGIQSGTTVTNNSGGEVRLAPVFSDDFTGSTLGTGWTTSPTGGGTSSVAVNNSILSLGATEIDSTQTYSNVAVEASLDFGAAPYQHFGLATSLSSVSGNSWAMFSTGGTTNTLFARVNANGTTQDVSLGALPSGFHDYLIQPVSGGFAFYVDGVLQTTISATFPSGTLLKIVFSDYNGSSQAPLQADWVRVNSYSSTGTFTSSVFDATRTATWGAIRWDAILPPGTTITVQTQTSDDGTNWSDWTDVSNVASTVNADGSTTFTGTVNSPSARYIRYQVILTTNDPTQSPTFLDLNFSWA
jgi:methionine-rich copper-binding protein CopC